MTSSLGSDITPSIIDRCRVKSSHIHLVCVQILYIFHVRPSLHVSTWCLPRASSNHSVHASLYFMWDLHCMSPLDACLLRQVTTTTLAIFHVRPSLHVSTWCLPLASSNHHHSVHASLYFMWDLHCMSPLDACLLRLVTTTTLAIFHVRPSLHGSTWCLPLASSNHYHSVHASLYFMWDLHCMSPLDACLVPQVCSR